MRCHSKVNRQNVEIFSPIVVSKQNVRTLIDFLVELNPYYRDSGTTFSAENMEKLFSFNQPNEEDRVLCEGVQIDFLETTEAVRSATTDYTDQNEMSAGGIEQHEQHREFHRR